MSLRLDSRGRVVALAVGGAAAAAIAAFACIPDLPSSSVGSADSGPQADQQMPEAAPGPRCGDGIIQLDLGEQCDPGVFVNDAATQGCRLDCKMDCDGGVVWERNNHCYLDEGAATVFVGGATYKCGTGPHVVTFASEEELEAGVTATDAGAFWVGMTYSGGDPGFGSAALYEPGWGPTCQGCFAHAGVSGSLAVDGGCVRGFEDLARPWEGIACAGGMPHRVVCEREPAGKLATECEAGLCFELVWTRGKKRYVLVRPAATADDAELACRALGGALVVLQSRDEREQLWRELSRNGAITAIWIGLSIADGGTPDAGPWIWDDDAAADAYPPVWADQQPAAQTRAFLYKYPGVGPEPIDDTLGHADVKTAKLDFVCQLPP